MLTGIVKPPIIGTANSVTVTAAGGGGGGGIGGAPFGDNILFFSDFEGDAGTDATGHTPQHMATGVTWSVQAGTTYAADGNGLSCPAGGGVWIEWFGLPDISGQQGRVILLEFEATLNGWTSGTGDLQIIDRYIASTQGYLFRLNDGTSNRLYRMDTVSQISAGSSYVRPTADAPMTVGTVFDEDGAIVAQAGHDSAHNARFDGCAAYNLSGFMGSRTGGRTYIYFDSGLTAGDFVLKSAMVVGN